MKKIQIKNQLNQIIGKGIIYIKIKRINNFNNKYIIL